MTNADRFRSMTDEELAMILLCPAEYDAGFNKGNRCCGGMKENCFYCTLHWLQDAAK